jgi:hypothetical protein
VYYDPVQPSFPLRNESLDDGRSAVQGALGLLGRMLMPFQCITHDSGSNETERAKPTYREFAGAYEFSNEEGATDRDRRPIEESHCRGGPSRRRAGVNDRAGSGHWSDDERSPGEWHRGRMLRRRPGSAAIQPFESGGGPGGQHQLRGRQSQRCHAGGDARPMRGGLFTLLDFIHRSGHLHLLAFKGEPHLRSSKRQTRVGRVAVPAAAGKTSTSVSGIHSRRLFLAKAGGQVGHRDFSAPLSTIR